MTHGKDWFASDDPHQRNDNARKMPPAEIPTITELGRFASDDPHPRNDNARKIPAPLPSITDLGRLAATASTNSERYDRTLDPTQPAYDGRQGLLCDRDLTLRTLLTYYRATSLTDAITQLYAGFMIADDAANNDLAVADHVERADSLRRIFLSTLPILATSAGFDLTEIGADHIAGYADRQFPAEA